MNQEILDLAHQAIEAKFNQNTPPSKQTLTQQHQEFSQPQATFVTITLDGNLRGCIGSIVAHRDLYDDLISNAQNAAFSDPRFPPLGHEEFEKVDIEVSLLTQAKPLMYENIQDLKSKIKTGHHGVILKLNNAQATFLPQVWEQLPTFEQFFAHLCQKARLNEKCLEQHPEIFTYEVQKVQSQ